MVICDEIFHKYKRRKQKKNKKDLTKTCNNKNNVKIIYIEIKKK